MSSVTEVAVPTSDFDGNAPVNGSRCMASTFSESRGFSGDSACREESPRAGRASGAFGLRDGPCRPLVRPELARCLGFRFLVPSRGGEAMTVTVGARSLDNEERSNFRDYMSLLSLSVDASMTVREIMAVAYLIGRHDALRDVRNASSPARTVNRRLIHGGPSDCVFNRGYEAGAGMVSDEIDALMRDVEALSGDDAVFSMLRHPSVSGGDEWWNW